MEQTYGFFGFILYLLSFLGCGGQSHYFYYHEKEAVIKEEITKEERPQYEIDYYQSLEIWQQETKKHNNSYEYTLFFENSTSTYRCSTIVVVKEGIIQSREQKAYLRDSQTNEMVSSEKETWKENQEQLGTHNDAPKTFEELYEDCSIILKLDPESNSIFFIKNDKLLITICGYSNIDCADDCFQGVSIRDFKWLD
jgi:hypothetical protein